MKNKPIPLSHKEFKRNYVATSNPKVIAIQGKIDETLKSLKKEGKNDKVKSA